MKRKFCTDRHRPIGEWVQATPAILIWGTAYREEQFLSFVRLASNAEEKRNLYGVELEREPTNLHYANAIKVIGFVDEQGFFRKKRHFLHIGYISRETADEITVDLIENNIPIAAELYAIYENEHEDDYRFEARIIILAPAGNSHATRIKKRHSKQA